MTLDDFMAELARFRELMGKRSFWSLDQRHHDGALAGLAFGYLRVQVAGAAELQRVAVAYDSTVQSYHRRAEYHAIRPPAAQ